MPNHRVLIIEDDEDARFIINKSLASLGCEIIEAGNGIEALKALKASDIKFDLIITDLMMPELGGKEFINQYKSLPGISFTPILVLTAKSDISTKEEILELGGDDYLTKPFNKRDLLAKAKVLIRINQLTLDLDQKNRELVKTNSEVLRLQNELLREEREKTKRKLIVSSLHMIRQPLTNALLLAGVLKGTPETSPKIEKLISALNDINTTLKDLEHIDVDDHSTYINNIEMLKSKS